MLFVFQTRLVQKEHAIRSPNTQNNHILSHPQAGYALIVHKAAHWTSVQFKLCYVCRSGAGSALRSCQRIAMFILNECAL